MELYKGILLKPVNLRKDVKSFYVIKHIFSLLKKRKRLKMIIYNKVFQNKFKIDINYYIKISGRKIIGERNGKGKEYVNNKLIFEGEYLNGKRNGKGKEFYPNSKVKFEGDYLNNNKI